MLALSRQMDWLCRVRYAGSVASDGLALSRQMDWLCRVRYAGSVASDGLALSRQMDWLCRVRYAGSAASDRPAVSCQVCWPCRVRCAGLSTGNARQAGSGDGMRFCRHMDGWTLAQLLGEQGSSSKRLTKFQINGKSLRCADASHGLIERSGVRAWG
jgi:hypothetical protein